MGGKICRIFHQSARPMPEELRRPISKLGHAPNTGDWSWHVAMDQYLLIPFLGGWTSIYQLFWCSPGVQGFDPSPCGFPSLSFHSITFFFDPHLRGANVLASWIVLLPSRTWRWKWKFHLVQPSWSGDSRIANDFCETPGFLNPRCWSLGELPF